MNVSRGLIFFRPHPDPHPPLAQPFLESQGLLILVSSRSHSVGLGRTPLDESSARCSDLDLTTHNTQKRRPCPRRDSNPNPGKRAAADPCLIPRGHGDRHAQQIPMNLLENYTVYSYVYDTTWRHISEYSNLQLIVAGAPNLTKTKNINI